MGANPFTAVVKYHRGPTTSIDFLNLDIAIGFARDRVFDPLVSSVEILCGDDVVWTAARLEEWREVIARRRER